MIMSCNCAANALRSGTGKACCLVHGTEDLRQVQPDLTGREARCGYCKRVEPSRVGLAFFRYKELFEFDEYYCGCRGFD